ncbi:hypothetical protein NQ318_009840 [Aromia moschata]|uniref:Uncharacterized protein n=1 Tax=Aromia moschata TaxID=1265417 RepID=A0AAV8XMZ8_9CUCU|nr:hypothetical protein NQ318_009840 [Aromia moschata]
MELTEDIDDCEPLLKSATKKKRTYTRTFPEKIIQSFNLLSSIDKQNIYLCGLITIVPIKQRRPRQPEQRALPARCFFSVSCKF